MKDPLRTVHDALGRVGCDPRGPEYKFTARCPAHEDRDPSLSVSEGSDGRALIWCHAGCATGDVLSRLGLDWSDLFPPGHHHARPRPRAIAKRRGALELVLQSLNEMGIGWRCTRTRPDQSTELWVAESCPACHRAPLWVFQQDARVGVACFEGCDQLAVLNALASKGGVA